MLIYGAEILFNGDMIFLVSWGSLNHIQEFPYSEALSSAQTPSSVSTKPHTSYQGPVAGAFVAESVISYHFPHM